MEQHPRYQAHLTFTHHTWESVVRKGDLVIDATCGNGHDTLLLAKLAVEEEHGLVIGYDIQQSAIEATRTRLKEALPIALVERVELLHTSHANLGAHLPVESVRLIVYNLGYLPKGDKQLTTLTESTLQSVRRAQRLIMVGGMICITCYPGHAEGEVEEQALLEEMRYLDPLKWECSYHRWINKTKAPSVLLITKTSI